MTRESAAARMSIRARHLAMAVMGLAATVVLSSSAGAALPTGYPPGGVYHVPQRYWLPLEPIPIIERNPHEGDVPSPLIAVPRTPDIAPATSVFIPAAAYLECKDLGSVARATLYWKVRGRPVRLDSDGDGIPCEGWTWGNGSKPACELRALRDERATRMWVYHGVRYYCFYDDEYGYVSSATQTYRRRGTGNVAARIIHLDGDEEPGHGNPIADTTFAHETGHQAQLGVSLAERQEIMKRVEGLDTDNGWGGPGSYFRLPSESWAESWVRCMTPYPWRSTYVPIPCAWVKAALLNQPFPDLPPQPAPEVPSGPVSPAQAAE